MKKKLSFFTKKVESTVPVNEVEYPASSPEVCVANSVEESLFKDSSMLVISKLFLSIPSITAVWDSRRFLTSLK